MSFSVFLQRYFPVYLLPIIVIAIAALWPSLSAGLIADDWWHYIWLQGLEQHPQPRASSFFDLFSFASADNASREYLLQRGGLPWWASTSLEVNFWRPVAELTHWDYRLFGLDQAMYLHAHSIAWFVAYIIVLHRFYQKLVLPKAVLILALLIVVTEPFHSIAATWLANRNILIAAFFVFLSLNLMLVAIQNQRTSYQLWAIVFYTLALLSSEAATSLLAFLIAYVIFYDARTLKQRLTTVFVFFSLTVAWLLIYRALAYGAAGNAAMYVDPIAQPMVFLRQLIERIPLALSLQILVLPKLFPEFWTPAKLILSGVFLLLALAFVVGYSKSRLVGFSLMAFVLAVVPLASALLHERNFIFLSAALAPLLAQVIRYFWLKASCFYRAVAVFLFIYKIVLGFVLCWLAIWYFTIYGNGQLKKTAFSLPEEVIGKHVLLLGVPALHSSFIYPLRLAQQQTLPLSLQVLFSDAARVKVKGVSEEGQWFLEAEEGWFSEEDALLRDWQREPFYAGQVIAMGEAELKILAVDQQHQLKQAKLSLPSKRLQQYMLLCWEEGRWIICSSREGG